MSYIAVNTLYLRNLASRTREVESTLRQFSGLTGTALNSSPIVRAGYNKLNSNWDQRRGELADALSAIADSFDATWRSFEQTDSDLAGALEG